MQCDIRIAGQSAKWGEIFVRRGLIPDTGAGTYLLPHIVGLSKAAELCMSGEVIDANEMLRIGLVHQVVPDDQLIPTAMELAKKFLKAAPLAVRMTKQLLYMGLERTIEHHSEATRYCFQLATKSEDMMEGIKSFLEKRNPVWKKQVIDIWYGVLLLLGKWVVEVFIDKFWKFSKIFRSASKQGHYRSSN